MYRDPAEGPVDSLQKSSLQGAFVSLYPQSFVNPWFFVELKNWDNFITILGSERET
jgi:hypothetical protein